jgi:hypothetical protein
MDPSDSVLVAYLPKLDMVVQELYQGDHTLHVVDGVVIDMTGPKAVRWWQVRAAVEGRMQLIQVFYFGKARDFTVAKLNGWHVDDGSRLHMRAYSHGPWICIEPEQLEKVYANGDEQT